jgi:Tfp pilus assembly protein FimT
MRNLTRGISLIEIVVIMAIVGLMISVAVPGLVSFRKNQSIQNSTNSLMSLLDEARTKTLASFNTNFYSVKIESSRAILFTGSTYSSIDVNNKIILYESPVVLNSTALNGSGSVISFDRLKGTTSQYGTITLGIPSGVSKIVTVSSGGVITRN